MTYKIIILLFLLMLESHVNAKSHDKMAYDTVLHKVACAPTKKEAILSVNAVLQKSMGIDDATLYSHNVYIRHKNNGRGDLCLEGIVTQEGVDAYLKVLKQERKRIVNEISHVDPSSKISINETYQSICNFNKKVEVFSQNNSKGIKKILVSKKSLSKTKKLSKKPTKYKKDPLKASFKITGCGGDYTIGCRVLFISSNNTTGAEPQYEWDFGDGSHSKRKNPIHYYKKAGNFKISLRIKSRKRTSKLMTKSISVKVPKGKKAVPIPKARIDIEKKRYIAGDEITFKSLVKHNEENLFTYNWQFSDGSTSHECHPKHRFKKPGHYLIKLEMRNTNGVKSVTTQKIEILHPAMLYGVRGRKFNRIVRKFGRPIKAIEEKGVLTCAYQYGEDWLLVKKNKVVCRVKGAFFKTNMMGNPKNCRWYEKNQPMALYDVK